jgi:hypothetical protein
LKAKDNDPTLVKLVTDAATCKLVDTHLDYDCDASKAWTSANDQYKDGKGDATLTNFLEDPNENVRFVAAEKLRDHEPKDVTLIKRDLAAAQAETSKLVGENLGMGIGKLDVTSAGVAADAVKLLDEGKLVELRVGIMHTGADNPAFSDAILKLANESTDATLHYAAVTSFYSNMPKGKEADVCKMWLAMVDSTDNEVAGQAALEDGRVSACKDNWDALMDKFDASEKAGTFKAYNSVAALNYIHDGSTATDAQKTRSIELAKTIASDEKVPDSTRGRAIEFLAPNDAKFVQKFTKDKNEHISFAAEHALKH